MIKPWPLRPAIPGGFTLDDFTHDPTTNTVTCPNGITRPITRHRSGDLRSACRGCPLRAALHHRRPPGATSPSDPTTPCNAPTAHRAASPEHLEAYRRHRPMVERSIAWLTRGNRRVPHRGVVKNNAWLHTRVAALNLRRLLTLGLHLDHGRWALAAT